MSLKFKSVDAAKLYLEQNESSVGDEESKKLEEQRNKCTIYRLMHNNEDPAELNYFLNKLVECLARDRVFPPAQKLMDQHKFEKADITSAQAVLTHVINGRNLVLKRMLIWLGLRISSSFINIFCPPPDEKLHRRFLVDPGKLAMMIKGEEQPLRFHLSSFCNNNQQFTLEHCLTSCCVEWNSLMPWLDHDTWSGVDANAPSANLIASAKRQKLCAAPHSAGRAYIADGTHQLFLEYDQPNL